MKLAALILVVLVMLYNLFLEYLKTRSEHNPIPETVKDVYDAETYTKWKHYSAEKSRLSIVRVLVTGALSFVLLLTNAYALIGNPIHNPYLSALAVLMFSQVLSTVVEIPFNYRFTLHIEEKYGFNRSTVKTFWMDELKSFLIGLLPVLGLTCLFVLLHQKLGDWVLLLSGIILFLVILFINFLSPVLMKIFNKFTPLEDGTLKTRLTELLEKHGYHVRAIQVMDASKRSTKSNAYFTGLGKMKTIVLYDTLVNAFTEDEICAVFAHEMGHGLHKDMLKRQLLSILMIALLAVFLWLNVRTPAVSQSFGFADTNYGFAIILLLEVEMAVLSPLIGLLQSWVSCRAEYRADAQACAEGCGDALIDALKKLNRENLGDLSPSPLLVKLTYSHPTLDQRIRAIQKESKKN